MILGDPFVGKTTFIDRLITNYFTEYYFATIHTSNGLLTIPMPINNEKINFKCCECAGREIYKGQGVTEYSSGADCAIIMYDNASRSSYYNVERWINLLDKNDIPKVVCCNKTDLQQQHDINTYNVVARYSNCMQTKISVKTGYNLESPFNLLAQKLINL